MEFTLNLKDSPIFIENGEPVISLWFSDALGVPSELIEFVKETENSEVMEEIGLKIQFPLSTLLEWNLNLHYHRDSPEGELVLEQCAQPVFQAIRNQLAAAIATIDSIKYKD